jgi:methylated-DNA-[protein]-cysteine S-methyltransferase
MSAAAATRADLDRQMVLCRATIATPLGEMLALASDAGLCALEFTGPGKRAANGSRRPAASLERLPRLAARLRRHFPPHEIVDREAPAIAAARAWLDAYFAGASADISDLRLDMHGAEFETRVWRALTRIPAGETTSYGAIAKAFGSAGASRAVGAANGANPIAIIVPCHRVIGSSGSLTGYGGGLDRKTWLLNHEKRWSRVPLLF